MSCMVQSLIGVVGETGLGVASRKKAKSCVEVVCDGVGVGCRKEKIGVNGFWGRELYDVGGETEDLRRGFSGLFDIQASFL